MWLHAQAPAELPVAKDLHEQVFRIPVSVQDLYRRREQRQIPVSVFKPAGDGPFPMVVLNHGRATSAEKMAQPSRFRFEQQARYFVGKGFVVMVPTRVGYGETFDGFDPETNGGCSQPRVEPMSLAASDQVLAVAEFARGLPFVDANRWWVMGQSVGGLTTVATTWRNPPGLQGAVNFAGGTGGDPVARPGRSCAAAQIEQLWKSRAAQAKAPMLWLYWENDLFWGPQAPRSWHRAWVEGGGQAEFHLLPAVGQDGHSGFSIDMDRWVPLVDAFLAKAGYTQPALPPVPAPSDFARIDEIDKVPVGAETRQNQYTRFLASPLPRAFAIGPGGAGFATGDWAVGRALGLCQARRGITCKLYAVDNEVVWRK
jgi:dienelactone hydrolase